MKKSIIISALIFSVSNISANTDNYSGQWDCVVQTNGKVINSLFGKKGLEINNIEPNWALTIDFTSTESLQGYKYDNDPPLFMDGILKTDGTLYQSLTGKAVATQNAALRILWASNQNKSCLMDGLKIGYTGSFKSDGTTMTGTINYNEPIQYCQSMSNRKILKKKGNMSLTETYSCKPANRDQ